jgi:hypothetical protein
MRFRAPIIAAALLGLAIMIVWFRGEEPVGVVSESAPVPPVAAPPVGAGAEAPASDAAPPPFPPPQEPTGRAGVAAQEAPRSPLPGEALTTPLTQLLEDQRALLQQPAPAGIGQEFPRIQRQFAESERAFGAEPIDASWAPGAEAHVLGKVAQIHGLELLDLRVECRSTLCRLQMAQPGGQGTIPSTDLIDTIGLEPHWVLSLAGRAGSVNTVAYLWREGFAPARSGAHEEPSDGDN